MDTCVDECVSASERERKTTRGSEGGGDLARWGSIGSRSAECVCGVPRKKAGRGPYKKARSLLIESTLHVTLSAI